MVIGGDYSVFIKEWFRKTLFPGEIVADVQHKTRKAGIL